VFVRVQVACVLLFVCLMWLLLVVCLGLRQTLLLRCVRQTLNCGWLWQDMLLGVMCACGAGFISFLENNLSPCCS
jgi:hypothetical protein